MKITKEDVLRVAELAHLDMAQDEIENYVRQLDAILSYSEKLNEVNTDGIEAMTQVIPPGAADLAPASTPLREDIPLTARVIGDVLAGAPDPAPPYFRVPKVIER